MIKLIISLQFILEMGHGVSVFPFTITSYPSIYQYTWLLFLKGTWHLGEWINHLPVRKSMTLSSNLYYHIQKQAQLLYLLPVNKRIVLVQLLNKSSIVVLLLFIFISTTFCIYLSSRFPLCLLGLPFFVLIWIIT